MYLPIAMLNAYRGCPFTCAFCAHNRTWGYKELEGGYQPLVRKASLERLTAEIRHTVSEYGIRAFGFTDSTPIPQLWRELALSFLKLDVPVAWTSFAYIGHFCEADFDLFARSGCAALWYGIESANPEIRARIGKPFTNDEVFQTFEWANSRGIVPIPGFIMGFPGETIESFTQSTQFAARLHTPVTVFSPFILDPGTPIALNPGAFGIEVEPDWECKIVRRVGINEFEIPYYKINGISNVDHWNRFQQTGMYPGFDKDRNIAESEFAYLLSRSHGVDPTALVRELDLALKTRNTSLLRKLLYRLWM
jgi:radical SAM superfamily enzyme YgiQ (UPF0313 family)